MQNTIPPKECTLPLHLNSGIVVCCINSLSITACVSGRRVLTQHRHHLLAECRYPLLEVCLPLHACVCVCVCACVHACVCVCVCVCVSCTTATQNYNLDSHKTSKSSCNCFMQLCDVVIMLWCVWMKTYSVLCLEVLSTLLCMFGHLSPHHLNILPHWYQPPTPQPQNIA